METYFYLYQITNLVNGKIYVGVHRTKNIDDGYFGSGKALKNAVAKYGLENFKKEILEKFSTAEEMFSREKEVVTEEFIAREDVYNLRRGGLGGFDHINDGSDKHRDRCKRAAKKCVELYGNNFSGIRTRTNFANSKEMQSKACTAAMSSESKKKRKETFNSINHQQGSRNSQYGTKVYVNLDNPKERKRFKDEEVPENWIWSKTYKEIKMESSLRWYNNGIKNFYVLKTNPLIEELSLIPGRISLDTVRKGM